LFAKKDLIQKKSSKLFFDELIKVSLKTQAIIDYNCH